MVFQESHSGGECGGNQPREEWGRDNQAEGHVWGEGEQLKKKKKKSCVRTGHGGFEGEDRRFLNLSEFFPHLSLCDRSE